MGRAVRSIRAGTSCSCRSTSRTACRAGAGRSAASCWSERSRWRTVRRSSRVVHRLRRRRSSGAARADAALHLAERPRRAACRRSARGRRDGGGFVFEGAYRVDGLGWNGGGKLVSRRPRARGGRARSRRPRGSVGRRHVRRRARARRAATRWSPRRRRSPGLPPRRRRSSRRARRAAAELVQRAGVTDETAQQLVLAADQFAITPPGARPPSPATRGSASGHAT